MCSNDCVSIPGPGDYSLSPQPITFSDSNPTRVIPVIIVDDSDIEPLERFTATLTVDRSQFPGVSLAPDLAEVEITDNDGEHV